MKENYSRGIFLLQLLIFIISVETFSQNFTQSQINFNGLGNVSEGVTSLMYGPDGRLYVAEYPGTIKILTIERNGPTDYVVTNIETLSGVKNIVNHDDDGSPCTGTSGDCSSRETTGLTVAGTASNPIIYVTSSDFRIGAGSGGGNGDIDLDTNSGVITRFTWTGTEWDVVDLVRGLPRSEENHATNGLEVATINGTEYLIVASGGITNGGAPSTNFVFTCEYALSGAILSVDLDAINLLPTQTDVDGREFIYDLPTLDDPTRANANGITDPNDPNYDGIDLNDPWGGNDGLNQAMVVTGGPVQIYSPGYRNAYDIVLTESGALYATDNGANGGWGGFPVNEGVDGTVTNAYDPAEPGSQSSSGGEIIDNKDHLQLITTDVQSYVPGSLYGGHPNPTRANPSGAGLFTDNGSTQVFRTLVYDPDGSTLGSTSDPSIALPANWPPVKTANPVEGDWRSPSSTNPDGPDDDPVVIWGTNTNGIDEYTASNFSGAMQGNLLAGNNGGYIRRVQLQTDGSLQNLTSNFLSGIGGNALGITCNSDNDIFPGTIWAGTLNGLIVVFEPQDFIQCDNPEGEPLADFDGDGYTNQDELDNGTDPCNGGSQPDDFDKSAGAPLVSNLNDLDDDNDGIPDASDPFQLGDPETSGSDAFVLPIGNDLFNDQQGLGGIFGLGMTGLMNNGDTAANWLDWIDDRDNGPNPNDVLGGAPGIMTSHMTEGTALGASNNQDKGYQYGVQVDNTTGKFAVVGGMNGFTGPLRLYENTDGVSGGELGFFIGDGTQSNYIKFVVTTDGFTALQEIDDIPGTPMEAAIALGDRPTSGIRFYFVVDPVVGTVDLEYEIDSNPRTSLGQINASGTILQAIQTNSLDLAVGFIGSSNTPGKELEGSWDFLNVISEEPITDAGVVARVNASGSLVTDPIDGVDWQSNDTNGATSGPGYSVNTGTGYPSGLLYANRHPSIPASMNQSTFESLFELERYDPETGEEMEFLFPVANGNYVVNLYLGNSFSGTSQVGDRVFDIAIEGQVVGQNIDLVALFGHESGGMLSYQVDVQDSELNVQFIHEVQNPLVNAIEILSIVPDQNPIIVEPIANQHNMEGDILDGSLGVVASGGDGNLSFSAFNLPPGVFIEPTNGQIGGAIEPLAATGSPYSVSIVVDDGDEQSLDAVTINFDWTIISNNLSWTDKDEDESYTARHENSFVQSGIHFYVMGGRENATSIDVYDYTNDSWTELTGITPTVDGAQLEFNHFQATEYKGLIWVIGAFKSNAYPNEVPAEYIWMFDPASQEWIQGPQIPEGRRRGSAGLALYNDKFYVVGGNNDGHDGGYVAQFDEYDPATGTWTTLTDAPRARDHFSAVVIGDKLYVAGGRISGGTNGVFKPVIAEVDVYDFTSGTWSTLPSDQNIPTPRAGAAAVNFNDKLIVIGGEVQNELVYGVSTDDALSITEEYDPVTQTWDRLPDMNYERQGIQAIVSGPGVHVLGGSPNRGGGNQKNLEYLGEDAPVGTPIVGSALSAPTTVVFNDGETLEIDLDVIDGNTGLFISSMEVTGADAADYSIVSGALTNILMDANSSHTLSVALSGTGADRTATLTINYGGSSTLNIALTNNADVAFGVTNPGDQYNYEGDAVSLQIEATSPNNTTYSATGLPPSLTINENTGIITGTIDDGFVSGIGDNFVEENGLVIIEAESGDTTGWDITNLDGESGIIANTNSLNSINGNTISYEITIRSSGVYRFNWKNFFSGPTPADENDSWLRFPNNDDVWFFGIDASTPEGDPANEAEIIANLQGAQSEIVFPIGSSRITASTTPDGAGADGYFKVYRSSGNSETYDWQARTSDNNDHNIYVWFVNPGTYTMEVSERSSGHAIDRMALYKVDTYGYDYSPSNLENAPESQQGGVFGSGAAENSPYNVSVTVTDDGDPVNEDSVDFLWYINGPSNNSTPTAVASAVPVSGNYPLEVDFVGSGSTDDVGIASYSWDFGDGNSSTEADPVYTYTSAGVYIAELTVTDGEAQTDTDTVTITVTESGSEGITGLILVDALTDVDMFMLTEGQQIDLGPSGGQSLNIRAEASGGEGSVFIELTGPVSATRREGVAPYALFGDISGDYNTMDLPLGDYTLTATAYNGSNTGSGVYGQPMTINFSIVSGGGQPPIALATSNLTSGDMPLTVGFVGSGSSDDVGIASYSWDFGDGNGSTEADPSYTYTSAGTFDAELTVTDDDGLTDTDTVTIEVIDPNSNEAPTAVASAVPVSGDYPLEVIFTGSGSIDDVGIASYSWDFGDGNSSTEADPVHTYTSAGVYIAELTVTDGEAQTDTDTVTITVTESGSEGITGLILVDALTDVDMFMLTEGQQIDLGPSGGQSLNIRAEASGGEGSVFIELTGPVSATRREGVAPYALFGDISGDYNTMDLPLGDYTLTATAYNGSNTGSGVYGQPMTINFSIVSGGGQPPIALATSNLTSGDMPLTVGFVGSGSSDDVGIASYSWDFGDGNGSTEADPSYTYTSAGTFDAELTVTDDDGLTDTDTVTIEVIDPNSNEAPTAVASAVPVSGDYPLEVIFTGSGSIDDVGIASYSWDFGDGNSSTEADPVHTYTSAGVYIAELTVTDGEAQSDTDTVTISVTGPITEGVLSFTLIDALNNSDMFELVDGQVLDFGTTGGLDLNIRANASENTGRVSFVLTGPVSNTKSEGVAPYALFGDISGNYNQVDLPLGDYILSATGSSGGVTIGQPLTIEFSIVSGATAKGIDSQNLEESLDSMGNVDEVIPFDIILYPNPGATQITISTKSLISEVMDIRIFDSTGQLVRSFSPTEFKDGSDYTLPIQSLQAAVYHLGILTQDGKTYFKQMIVRK